MKRTILCVIVGIAFLALAVPTIAARTESQIEHHYPRLKTYAVVQI
jgi:hypothetical protein